MKDAKGIFLMLGGVALLIVVIGLINEVGQGKQNILSPYLHTLTIGGTPHPNPTGLTDLRPITIGKTTVMINIANTDVKRSKGLGGITNLPIDQGMLFDFGNKNIQPANAAFWMKDMHIALDFIWIDNNVVVEITPNVPAPKPGTPNNELPVYGPSEVIDYVLEVNAGFAQKNNIKVGDKITGL
ncbi:hypothetical protein BH10PAT1_BH10PAT1_3740 [soil metagenome]